jgi:hypothetical protein
MDREEWMYKILRVGNDLVFLEHIRKFAAVVEKHRVRLGRERIICQCNSCKNTPPTPSFTTNDGSVLYGYCY